MRIIEIYKNWIPGQARNDDSNRLSALTSIVAELTK